MTFMYQSFQLPSVEILTSLLGHLKINPRVRNAFIDLIRTIGGQTLECRDLLGDIKNLFIANDESTPLFDSLKWRALDDCRTATYAILLASTIKPNLYKPREEDIPNLIYEEIDGTPGLIWRLKAHLDWLRSRNNPYGY